MKRHVAITAAILVLVVAVCGSAYMVRNPEHASIDDAARKSAPGRFIRLSDGVTHYDVSGPGSGRLVVLVHGFSVPYYIWDSTAAALAGAGFRVMRYDEYGRGWSDRPNVEYTADLYDRQLGELLDSLHVRDKIDLAGVSMGGWVAGTFTARHANRVRTLTLIDPVAGRTAESLGKFGTPVIGELLWQYEAVPKLPDGQAGDFLEPQRFPGWADRYREQMRYHGFGRSLLSTRRATLNANMDTVYASVGRTPVPVLLLWGMSDRTVPLERSTGVRLAMPNADFHAIRGAAHLPILEQASTTDSLMLVFLARSAAPSASPVTTSK
ncbi:MAG TPA: alpha/beta hydrolase [Gemmatimonadaceae bacterium]|jgi:pimeloyl-ACP methyl ester carboxylesterase|nr:alpha/beta hydrolase [Gemmatimonadaceae bacterium]